MWYRDRDYSSLNILPDFELPFQQFHSHGFNVCDVGYFKDVCDLLYGVQGLAVFVNLNFKQYGKEGK